MYLKALIFFTVAFLSNNSLKNYFFFSTYSSFVKDWKQFILILSFLDHNVFFENLENFILDQMPSAQWVLIIAIYQVAYSLLTTLTLK